jgi:hypothetical protein
MTWNHRVFRVAHENGEVGYGFRETFYAEDGHVEGWTENDIAPYGESPDELRTCLERMIRALDLPVLSGDTGVECAPSSY